MASRDEGPGGGRRQWPAGRECTPYRPARCLRAAALIEIAADIARATCVDEILECCVEAVHRETSMDMCTAVVSAGDTAMRSILVRCRGAEHSTRCDFGHDIAASEALASFRNPVTARGESSRAGESVLPSELAASLARLAGLERSANAVKRALCIPLVRRDGTPNAVVIGFDTGGDRGMLPRVGDSAAEDIDFFRLLKLYAESAIEILLTVGEVARQDVSLEESRGPAGERRDTSDTPEDGDGDEGPLFRPASHRYTPRADDRKALILVVDDIADIRGMIGNMLTDFGYRVITAANGRHGVKKSRQRRPDLIITDWMMPVMSGPELIAAHKSDPSVSSIPIILLTAKSDSESKLHGTEIGADAFLGKPFNEQELISIVRNLLKLKSREREVEKLNKLLTESVLKRHLPPSLVDDIIAGRANLVQKPRSAPVTILFADIVGFTVLASELRAARMARILNEYLARMNHVIFDHGGTIDKFIGDAIMVLFGAPTRMEPDDQAELSIRCALAMQRALAELNAEWVEEGGPPLQMRIGIHHGPVVVGTFGSDKRSDYTAIGPAVNIAARIERCCTPGEVFISGELYDYLPESVAEKAGAFELKGLSGTVNLYRVRVGGIPAGIRPSLLRH